MIGKIAELFNRLSQGSTEDLPDVYLDFSSVKQQYSTVALRIRNKSASAVTIDRIEFVDAASGQSIDITDCVVGGAKIVSEPVEPNSPGVLDVKGEAFRNRLLKAGLRGKAGGAIRAFLAGSGEPIMPTPKMIVDFDNKSVAYRHAGHRGRR